MGGREGKGGPVFCTSLFIISIAIRSSAACHISSSYFVAALLHWHRVALTTHIIRLSVAGLTDWGAWSWVSFDVFVFFACTLEFAVSKHNEIDMFFSSFLLLFPPLIHTTVQL